MADKKTHDETPITPLDGTEEVYVSGSAGTVDGKTTTGDIAAAPMAGLIVYTGSLNGLIATLLKAAMVFGSTLLSGVVADSNGVTGTVPGLLTASFPSLVYDGGALGFTANALTSLSLPALAIGGLRFTANSLTSLSVPVLANHTASDMSFSAPALVSFNLPAITNIGFVVLGVSGSSVSSLENVTLNAGLLSAGGPFKIVGAALTEVSVDHILVTLAALDGTNGTSSYDASEVDLSGGTSAAPSATGLTAKATLVGRGCTVTTN